MVHVLIPVQELPLAPDRVAIGALAELHMAVVGAEAVGRTGAAPGDLPGTTRARDAHSGRRPGDGPPRAARPRSR